MTVVPGRLERVTADETKAAKLEAVRAIADVGALNFAHHVGLASTCGARAGTPELLQCDVTFLAIAPGQREFIADHFGAEGMERGRIGHEEKLATVTDRRYIINS